MTYGLRLTAVLAIAVVLVAVNAVVFRGWLRTWGATDAEVAGPWLGDDFWPDATRTETRAVDVDAPVEAVWPWLAQLGQDRGGFYSYTLLENLAGARITNADHLLGLPDLRAGDRLWMAPPDAFGGVGYADVVLVKRPKGIVVLTHTGARGQHVGTWAFLLAPAGEGRSRLVVRGRSGRSDGQARPGVRLLGALGFDQLHFVMERALLLGVKARAEGQPVPDGRFTAEAISWLVLLAATLASAVLAVAREDLAPPLVVHAGSLAALLVLPLVHPPLLVTAGSALLVALACVGAFVDRQRAPP